MTRYHKLMIQQQMNAHKKMSSKKQKNITTIVLHTVILKKQNYAPFHTTPLYQ